MADAVAELVMTGTGIGSTVNVRIRLPVRKGMLAESVIMLVPAVVGVPEITPVIESRLKPAGKLAAPKDVGDSVAVML